MKRVIYFVSVVLAALTFVSCNNADDYSSESSIAALTTTDNFSAVKSQIKDLGEEKFGDYYVTTRGEKWKKFWTGVKNVLLADARGAVKGLGNGEFLVHGIVASLEKALEPKTPDTTCQKKPLCVIAYSSDVKCNPEYSDSVVLSTGETLADSVGFYHNQTIIGSLSDHPQTTFWLGLTSEEFVDTVCNEAQKVIGKDCGLLTSSQRADVINDVNNIKSSAKETPEAMVSEIYQENPKLGSVLDIILEYINQLYRADNFPDSKDYSQTVLDIINNSELTEDEKESLRVGISVAFASANLWNTNQN